MVVATLVALSTSTIARSAQEPTTAGAAAETGVGVVEGIVYALAGPVALGYGLVFTAAGVAAGTAALVVAGPGILATTAAVGLGAVAVGGIVVGGRYLYVAYRTGTIGALWDYARGRTPAESAERARRAVDAVNAGARASNCP